MSYEQLLISTILQGVNPWTAFGGCSWGTCLDESGRLTVERAWLPGKSRPLGVCLPLSPCCLGAVGCPFSKGMCTCAKALSRRVFSMQRHAPFTVPDLSTAYCPVHTCAPCTHSIRVRLGAAGAPFVRSFHTDATTCTTDYVCLVISLSTHSHYSSLVLAQLSAATTLCTHTQNMLKHILAHLSTFQAHARRQAMVASCRASWLRCPARAGQRPRSCRGTRSSSGRASSRCAVHTNSAKFSLFVCV